MECSAADAHPCPHRAMEEHHDVAMGRSHQHGCWDASRSRAFAARLLEHPHHRRDDVGIFVWELTDDDFESATSISPGVLPSNGSGDSYGSIQTGGQHPESYPEEHHGDAAGNIEMFLDKVDNSTDVVHLRQSWASLRRGMRACQHRQAFLHLATQKYKISLHPVALLEFATELTSGRQVRL